MKISLLVVEMALGAVFYLPVPEFYGGSNSGPVFYVQFLAQGF